MKIFKKISNLAFGNIFSQVVQLIIFIVLARYLGVSDFGEFTIALLLANFGVVIFDFGHTTFFTRELAFNRMSREEYSRRISMRVSWLTSASLILGCIFLALGNSLGFAALLVAASQNGFQLVQAFLKSKLQVGRLGFVLGVDRLVALFLILLIASQSEINPTLALLAWVVGQSTATLMACFGQNAPKISLVFGNPKEMISHGKVRHLALFSVTNLISSLDQVLLRAFGGSFQVGQFSAVAKWFIPFGLIGGSVSTVLTNQAATDSTGPWAAIRMQRTVWAALTFVALSVSVGSLFLGDLPGFLLGSDFEDSAKYLLPVSISASVILLNQPLAMMLQYFGLEKKVSKIVFLATFGYLGMFLIFCLLGPGDLANVMAWGQVLMQLTIFASLVCSMFRFKHRYSS